MKPAILESHGGPGQTVPRVDPTDQPRDPRPEGKEGAIPSALGEHGEQGLEWGHLVWRNRFPGMAGEKKRKGFKKNFFCFLFF